MNIKKHSLTELSRNEMMKVNGGEGWLFRLGRAAHEAYDKVVEAIADEFNNSDSSILGPTGNRYPGT